MPIKAILFDLDNTLIDFLTFKKESAKAAAKAMVAQGLPASEIETYSKIFTVYDEKGIEYQKTFADVVKQYNLEINLAEKIQQAAIIAYLKKKFEILRPYPLVKFTLQALREKGFLLGIVTDAPRNKAWQRLVLTGLENEFEVVITKNDTNEEKPAVSAFLLAAKKLGLTPSSCLFVGDNPAKDIKGAKEAGMITCLAKYGVWNRDSDVKADYEINQFEELIKIIEKVES
ncbi:MAG: TIGR02253 family HAD-type hydrolase [Candidatus Bilamarchaeaceae archaeon]